jgi:hypothetical protein
MEGDYERGEQRGNGRDSGGGGGVAATSGAAPGAPRHIAWDEGVIAEHDKDRGTRRKILEPKTPYRAGGGSVCSVASDEDAGAAGGALPAESLAAALQTAFDAGSEAGSGAFARALIRARVCCAAFSLRSR